MIPDAFIFALGVFVTLVTAGAVLAVGADQSGGVEKERNR